MLLKVSLFLFKPLLILFIISVWNYFWIKYVSIKVLATDEAKDALKKFMTKTISQWIIGSLVLGGIIFFIGGEFVIVLDVVFTATFVAMIINVSRFSLLRKKVS
ncbi:MAG: hypothetical protein JW938_04665 [Candidatus Omnitrophica bacterium]|nr:hypothetical protein [Candidatus Omnitrophota bacterium]